MGLNDTESTTPASKNGTTRDRTIKSVEHALDILEFLTSQRNGVGVTFLADELKLNVSTVHHLLKTLQSRKFIEQHPTSKLYRLGIRSLQVGQVYLADLDLYTYAVPYLKRAVRQCGETTTLAILEGRNIATLASVPGRHTVRAQGAHVSQQNIHATSLGKIFLATLPMEELHEFVAESGLTRFTSNTICSFRQLEEEINRVREQGYALDLEEHEEGVSCIGVGIRNHLGETVGAIAFTGPVTRFSEDRRPEFIRVLQAAARLISARLGYRPEESARNTLSASASGNADS